MPMKENTHPRKGPIFIVGMNGSGTTMLLDHLNNHSRIYGFWQETRILPYFLKSRDKFGDLADDDNFRRLWDEMRSAYPFWKTNRKKSVPLPDNWLSVERSPASVFEALIRFFADKSGKSRWSEKSPMYVLHIETISREFPDAQFIHMIRDGRDCAASFHRRWRFSPKHTIHKWKGVVEEGRRQGRALGNSRYIEVKFEELTTNPASELHKICAFLGEQYEESLLTTSRTQPRMQGKESAVMVPNQGKYRAYFTKGQITALERISGKTLSSLGYDTELGESDKDPSHIMLALWAIRNAAYRTVDEFRSKVVDRKTKGFSVLAGRIKSALQQMVTNRR